MARKADMGIISDYLEGEKKAHAWIDGWINMVVRNSNWGFEGDLEDLVQDVKLKLLENFQNNKFGFKSSVKTYVWRIAKYTCIDHLRCRKLKISLNDVDNEIIDAQNNPEEDLYEKEQREIFIKIFQSLPRHCRDLWRLVFDKKLPYAQIAKRLNISEGTVKSRFARCKEKAIQLGHKFSGNIEWTGSTINL